MTEPWGALAAVTVSLGAALAVGRGRARPAGAGWLNSRGGHAGATWALVIVAALTVVAAHPSRASRVIPALALGGAGAIGWRLVRQRRARHRAAEVSRRVLESCEQLAAELVSGQPPGNALEHLAATWPTLAPVAAAHRVGADVPAALRHLSRTPGAHDLRLLAAAWQVSHHTGQGLSTAIERVARDLVAGQRTERLIESELASARATARLVAGLPLLAWAMGSGAGGSPVGFLLQTPAGWACLASGLAFALAGLWWIEAIARSVERG
ncbi:type II secretion system F family protein [Nocardioides sp.]|uniref:type II secretion system F family protein n=1 Tax=Nocardioides sp. TaxID=35761 RepID=UPI003569ECC3